METTVRIPRILEPYAKGRSEICLHAATLNELFDAMKQDYPMLYRSVCDETGRLRQHVNIFIDDEMLLERENFKTRFEQSCVVDIFQAVSGG